MYAAIHRDPDDLNEGVAVWVLICLQLQLRVHRHQVVLLCLQASDLGTQGLQLCARIGWHRLEMTSHVSNAEHMGVKGSILWSFSGFILSSWVSTIKCLLVLMLKNKHMLRFRVRLFLKANIGGRDVIMILYFTVFSIRSTLSFIINQKGIKMNCISDNKGPLNGCFG